MIAFVIVAAALAFVVLNMGFSTSQKAKTTIISGLSEASSSMQIAGKVIGVGCITSAGCSAGNVLNATTIPIKITSGGNSVSLANDTTSIKYLSNSVEYDDIYSGPIPSAEYRSLSLAFDKANTDNLGGFKTQQPMTGEAASRTAAFIYWAVQSNTNEVLDLGEHAIIAIAFSEGDRPAALDKIKIELIVATGASLSVERQVPIITSATVDMG